MLRSIHVLFVTGDTSSTTSVGMSVHPHKAFPEAGGNVGPTVGTSVIIAMVGGNVGPTVSGSVIIAVGVSVGIPVGINQLPKKLLIKLITTGPVMVLC